MAFVENIVSLPLSQYAEKAYLDYSMSVILDRALPHLGDGLKPVQRRIIYAMSELGLASTAKFKKSARTVGDVLGKFHPHGDMACYEALVLMGQPFSYRYPLIQGQGNFGSSDDPKSFAAMRYTESRLSAYAESLLLELTSGAVEWVPNFDGTLDEPILFPARLPNILLNGATGIAVGMSTDIPPHCLTEVVGALIHLLDHPQASLKEIGTYILGPDYPTGGEIVTPVKDIISLYQSGSGSIRLRGTYQEEQGNIVITTLPYQVSGTKLFEQIAQQMQEKKLYMIADLRDESDHEVPIRLVIVPRSNRVDLAALMDHLFATTDLERSYRVNLNMIGLNGCPKIKGLLPILQEWLDYRCTTVRRRLTYHAAMIAQRLKILSGLMIVYAHLEAVIAILREQDEPKSQLMQRFSLNSEQVNAVLELKLRHLAKLEEQTLQQEQGQLEREAERIQVLLHSPKQFKALIREELLSDAAKHSDARRSLLVERKPAQAFKDEALISAEPVTVVLSKKGWVRVAKSHEVDPMSLHYKADDQFLMVAEGKNQQSALFFDSEGRAYALAVHTLASIRGQGEPLTGRLSPPLGAEFVSVLLGEPYFPCVLISATGYGFRTTLEKVYTKNRRGKQVLTLTDKMRFLVHAAHVQVERDYVAILSYQGKLLVLSLRELPLLVKGKGNQLMAIAKTAPARLAHKDYVAGLILLTPMQTLVLKQGQTVLRFSPKEWRHYIGERGKKGRKLPVLCNGLQHMTVEPEYAD